MKSYPKVSIVLLNYNGLSYLKKTIDPLLDISYPNCEFIVVDNCSTDGSLEYLEKYKNIIVIKNTNNLGYSRGKNLGVLQANGGYIWLLDCDILCTDSGLLEKIIEFYLSMEKVAYVSIPMINLGEDTTEMYGCYYEFYGQMNKPKISLAQLEKFGKYYLAGAPLGGNIFFSKKIWLDIGGYDEDYKFNIDDFDIGARSSLFGYKSFILNEKTLIHLGIDRRIDNKIWCWKFKYYLCAYSTIIIKNFKHPLLYLCYFHFFILLKTFKNILWRRSFCPLLSMVFSYFIFIRDLEKSLRKRREIQSGRLTNVDEFMKIRPPVC